MRSRWLSLLLAFALCSPLLAPPARSQGDEPDMVLPGMTMVEESYSTIAIPTFKALTRTGGLDPTVFQTVIYKDLELFSDFRRVRNQEFVEQTDRRDEKAGTIDYVEWQRLEAHFLLKGEFEIEEEVEKRGKKKEKVAKIIAKVFLYDVDYGHRVFGKAYKYPVADVRKLAHRISDEIVRKVFDETGIAGTQMVFASERGGKQNKEIFVMDADGGNQRRLTTDNSITAAPCWGKYGTEIYYTSWKDRNPDLCGVQLGTGKSWYISRWKGLNLSPKWHPATQRIVLCLGKDGNSEVYLMNRDGKRDGLKRLTYSDDMDSSPCWSPAGNQIAFVSTRNRRVHIYVMDSDGGDQRQITTRGSYNTSPAWSPRGDKIAFAGRDRGVSNIYTINVDGTGLTALTGSDDGSDEDPSWAPDGKHIVFSSDRTGRFHLYVMRDDGTNVHRLTKTGVNITPEWGPLPAGR